MKKLIFAMLATAAVTAISNTAQADVTIKNGKPIFVDLGISLFARRPLEGLATNRRAIVTLAADANVTAECTSPGGNVSKKVVADPISVGGVQGIPPRRISAAGEAAMRVATAVPDLVIEGAPQCPNTNWSETIVDLQFTQAVITVQQPLGTVVLTKTCTFSNPTADGLVPPANVVCN
jgi:hypothetical protein